MQSESSPQPPRHNGRRYLLGLGLGFIPVVFEWLSGLFVCVVIVCVNLHHYTRSNYPDLASFFSTAGLILYGVEILVMIPFLRTEAVRFVGYGMLTMVLIGPVVAVIGCSIISSAAYA